MHHPNKNNFSGDGLSAIFNSGSVDTYSGSVLMAE